MLLALEEELAEGIARSEQVHLGKVVQARYGHLMSRDGESLALSLSLFLSFSLLLALSILLSLALALSLGRLLRAGPSWEGGAGTLQSPVARKQKLQIPDPYSGLNVGKLRSS